MMRRIKFIRTQNKFTQQQVADALGISRSAYCGYEIGRRNVDIATLRKLAKFYNIKISCFFEEEDSAVAETDGEKEYVSVLTKEERELVTRFRIADKDKKQKILKSITEE